MIQFDFNFMYFCDIEKEIYEIFFLFSE